MPDCSKYCWNSNKCNNKKYVRSEAYLQEHLFEHFNSAGHNGFLLDASVTLIDKSDGKNHTNQEYYWQHNLKTLTPHGLINIVGDF